jgi:aminopeptidase N
MRRTVLAGVVAAAVAACGPVASRPAAHDAADRHAEAAAAPAPRWPDQARYELDVAYDARRFTLSGTERIAFRNVGPDALQSVWLRVWANAFGGCSVRRAHVTIRGGGALGHRRRDCTALEVRLPRPLALGADAEIALQIRVTAPPRHDRFGRFHRAAYFGNAIPVLAVTDRRGFQLPPYTFAGESFYSLTSSWRVRLRAPPGLQVASTGTQSGGRDAAGAITLVAPRARDFMLVVGRFSVRTARVGSIRLRRFSIPGTPAREVRRTLSIAALSMRRYAGWYGPYGRPEVDLVEGPGEVARGGVAMEYPEIVLTPAEPAAVAHELAHQWFYSIVGDDQWSEPWLDESFAEFSAARLPPRRVPNRLHDCRLPDANKVPLDASMATMTRGSGGRYVRTVYVGGACLLRAIQRALGRPPFDAFMRRLVATHRDGVVTTPEFVAAVRATTPGDATVERLLRRTGLT